MREYSRAFSLKTVIERPQSGMEGGTISNYTAHLSNCSIKKKCVTLNFEHNGSSLSSPLSVSFILPTKERSNAEPPAKEQCRPQDGLPARKAPESLLPVSSIG